MPRVAKAVEEVVPEPEEQEQEEPQVQEEEEYDSTKMDPKEELWEGGPTFAQINAWKEQFGDVFVTSVTPDKHFVWRCLTRFEYRRLVKNLEQSVSTGQVTQGEANMNNEESITEMCVLFPSYNRTQNVGEMAGIASTIAQQVMEASGFGTVEVRQL